MEHNRDVRLRPLVLPRLHTLAIAMGKHERLTRLDLSHNALTPACLELIVPPCVMRAHALMSARTYARLGSRLFKPLPGSTSCAPRQSMRAAPPHALVARRLTTKRLAHTWAEVDLSYNRLVPVAFELLQLPSELRLHLDHQVACTGVVPACLRA
jgi:hypothetical protein